MTVQQLSDFIRTNLREYYPADEISQLIFLIFNHLLNYSKIDIHLNERFQISDKIYKQTENIVLQLRNYKPIQYIFGETEFYGLKFYVNSSVLIPRPETEELVRWIIDDNKQKHLKILDVGTGSGCIAVTLAKFMKRVAVTATDLSQQAISMAEKNAGLNGVSVRLFKHDILSEENIFPDAFFDLVVSNPPYVLKSEAASMGLNVKNYEPGEALFVDDEDPLVYYRSILKFCKKYLKEKGLLYIEINELMGLSVTKLLADSGFSDLMLRKDLNGKDRMVRALLLIK